MPNILTSWKEISRYLGKGIRTVQRWERGAGLPVRRPVGPPSRAVLAMAEELDAWVRTRTQSSPGAVAEALQKDMTALRAENIELRARLCMIEAAMLRESPEAQDSAACRDLQRDSEAIRSAAQRCRAQAVRARLAMAATLCTLCENRTGEGKLESLQRVQVSALEVARSLGRPGYVSAADLDELRGLLKKLASRIERLAHAACTSGSLVNTAAHSDLIH